MQKIVPSIHYLLALAVFLLDPSSNLDTHLQESSAYAIVIARMSGVPEKEPLTEQTQSTNHRKRPSLLIRLAWRIEDAMTDLKWKHVAYKTCAFSYLALMMWICWWVLPIPGHWPSFDRAQSDKVPIKFQDFLK